MTNQDVFNMLDSYYTGLSTEGYLAYYNVYNTLVTTELLEFLNNPSINYVLEDHTDYAETAELALVILEHNTYFITVTRPFDITIPLF